MNKPELDIIEDGQIVMSVYPYNKTLDVVVSSECATMSRELNLEQAKQLNEFISQWIKDQESNNDK